MGEYSHISHGFLPVFDESSKLLVLGSLPSTSPADAAFSLERLVEVWKSEVKYDRENENQ